VTTQRGRFPIRWEWEIYRNGQSMAVRLREGGFAFERSARAAGNVVLREFLEALAREENARKAFECPTNSTARRRALRVFACWDHEAISAIGVGSSPVPFWILMRR
jgi:hypothetical protein